MLLDSLDSHSFRPVTVARPELPPILEHAENRPSFHEQRHLAYDKPARANDRLAAYAVLDLKIIKASNLSANNQNFGVAPTSDPYIEVYVDDVLKDKSQKVDLTVNPVWNWTPKNGIEIRNPASIVLLRVMDSQIVLSDDPLGFVEFPIADLPLNDTLRGWFRLSHPEELVGTAADRLKRALAREMEEDCGAVLLEATLSINSGDESDERFAWCLPPPSFQVYDAELPGLDAQGMIDKIFVIKTYVFYLIRPVFAFLSITLEWKDPVLSFAVFATIIGISFQPFFFLTGVLTLIGVFLLLLSDAGRRNRICAHPSFVDLDDEGYRLVSEMRDTDKMAIFVQRVVAALNGKVLDKDKFREFCAFCAKFGQPVTAFENLKHQLVMASKLPDPFINCSPVPFKPGTLVRKGASRLGEITECVNPQEPLEWRYKVNFQIRNNETKIETVACEELESRTDLRWMANKTVLALIPDSVEASIGAFHPTLDSIVYKLKSTYVSLRDILAWRNPEKCWKIVFGSILLGILCIWLQRTIMVGAALYTSICSTPFWVSWSRRRAASYKARQYAEKRCMSWSFLDGGMIVTRGTGNGRSRKEWDKPDESMGLFDALVCCSKGR